MFPADDLPTARVNLDTFPHSEHQMATTIPASMQDSVFDSQMESQAKIFGDGSPLLSQDESHQYARPHMLAGNKGADTAYADQNPPPLTAR